MKLWVARNKNRVLTLCTDEPILYYNEYFIGPYKSQTIELDENLYPEVTFENSPQMVEVKLINKE